MFPIENKELTIFFYLKNKLPRIIKHFFEKMIYTTYMFSLENYSPVHDPHKFDRSISFSLKECPF
jgi:hypothetical protein